MSDLKPCPFCGGKAIIEGDKIKWGECQTCECSLEAQDTTEEAIEAWNSRVELKSEYPTWLRPLMAAIMAAGMLNVAKCNDGDAVKLADVILSVIKFKGGDADEASTLNQ